MRHKVRTHLLAKTLLISGLGLFLFLLSISTFTVYTYTRAGMQARVSAAVPMNLNFQARLLQGSGAVVPDGSYSIEFNLYSAQNGGSSIWAETHPTVQVKNGYLSVYLGDIDNDLNTVDWSQQHWLTMNVNGDGEMNPRLRLTSVPYAFRAGQADGITNGAGILEADDLVQLSPSAIQAVNTALAALRINQTGTGLLAQFQGNGGDVFTLDKTGNINTTGSLDIGAALTAGNGNAFSVNSTGDITSLFTVLNGTSTASGGSGVSTSTSLTLVNASNFDVGNYVQMNSNNCGGTGINPCYAKITAKAGNTLTITPALRWTTGSTVNEYHIPEVGGVDTSQALSNRYGRAYFIAGVATGNGTTIYNEDGIESTLESFNFLNEGVSVINIGGQTTSINLGTAGTTVNITGNLTTSATSTLTATGGLRLGTTSDTTAGTLRWNGTDFEGYDGSSWVSLTSGGGVSTSVSQVMQTFNAYGANQGANATTAINYLMPTTTTAFSVAVAGTAEVRMSAEGSIRACSIMTSAAVTGGTVGVRFRKNGAQINGTNYCNLNSTTNRSNSEVINSGSVTFAAGDTIGVSLVSAALAPTTLETWVSFTVEYGTASTSSNFANGGNAFGGTAVLGTTDNNALQFITGGSARFVIDTSGNINISGGNLETGGVTRLTNSGALQNVTADTSILTSGLLGNARGGTGLDTSAAANGQILIGTGSGLALATLGQGTGLSIVNSSGGITLGLADTAVAAASYGTSDAVATFTVDAQGRLTSAGTATLSNNALQNSSITINAGTNIDGGGLVSLGGSVNIGIVDNPTFNTSVTTPQLLSSGALSITSGGSSHLTLESASGVVLLNAGTLRRVASGDMTLALNDAADTNLIITNTGGGAAGLSVQGGVIATQFTGSGSGLTNLDAGNISSGTLNDGRLSNNVALLDAGQAFTALTSFNSGVVIGNTGSATAGALRFNGTDFEGYNGTEWVSLTSGAGAPVYNTTVTKSSNETVNNSSAFQDDNELSFAVGANETWTFRFVVQASSGTIPDFKFAVTAPTGSTCRVGVSDAEGATTVANLGCGVSSGLVAGNGATDIYEIVGTITTTATTGNVRLQWAQNTADPSNTIVYAGSYLIASPVGEVSGGGSGGGLEFVQGGNAFGANAIIGTTDANGLEFITDGNTRMTIANTGEVAIANSLTVSSGGILVTGNSSITGALSGLTGLSFTSGNIALNNGSITGVGTDITAAAGLTIASGSSSNLTLDSASGIIMLNASTLRRVGSGVTTIALNDAADTTLTVNNSGGGVANLNLANGGLLTAGTSRLTNAGVLENITGLSVISGGAAITGNSTVTGTLGVSAGIDLSTSGISNTGALAGVTTIVTSGTINSNTFTGTDLTFGGASGTISTSANGSLTLSPNGSGELTLNTGSSGIANMNFTTLQRTSAGAFNVNLSNAGSTSLVLNNSGTGAASLVLTDGDLSTGSTPTIRLTNAGALQNITTLSLSGAISGATATNTINGLIVNAGALSGITGFAQTSGNFAMSGTGTFNTGTGAVSLNGNTSVTGANTFSVGTGLTSLGGAATVTGLATLNGGLTMQTGDTFTFNGDAITDLSGNGLAVTTNALTISLQTGSGLTVSATGLTNRRDCSNNQILKWANAGGGVWNCAADGVSDERLKNNIEEVEQDMLDKISQIRVVEFDYDCTHAAFQNMHCDTDHQIGVIAQELAQLFPELVTEVNGYYQVDYDALSVYNLKAVGELASKVESLEPGAMQATEEIKTGDVLRLDQSGVLQNITGLQMLSGGASVVGGLNNNGGGISEAGAIRGATTIDAQNLTITSTGSDHMLELKKDEQGVLTVFNNGALEIRLDATNAFNVKSANGLEVFTVDSINGQVRIGSGDSAKTILFMLDRKDDSTEDPAGGVNGASYYNSKLERFRCYQDNRWTDCLPVGNLTDPIAMNRTVWSGMPSADTEFPGEPRILPDLTMAHEFKLRMRVTTPGAAGATCRLQYALTDNGPWSDLMEGGSGELKIDAAGTLSTNWLAIKEDAQKEVVLRVMCKGGNNTASPVIFGVSVQLR